MSSSYPDNFDEDTRQIAENILKEIRSKMGLNKMHLVYTDNLIPMMTVDIKDTFDAYLKFRNNMESVILFTRDRVQGYCQFDSVINEFLMSDPNLIDQIIEGIENSKKTRDNTRKAYYGYQDG